jgi:phosphoribosyl-ATP pyrophosphohydrolase/phosphoribosyl-AMP cyclohydrolase
MPPELRPAIVQNARDGRVLMLAWMDNDALRLTIETGEAWFWSRSRQQLWKKGETSGNTLAVEELRDDCDGDAILMRVVPNGPACHTGAVSCFAPALWRTVVERVRDRPDGSYVAALANGGVLRAAQKVGEEAVETALAAAAGDGRLGSEAADLLFHLYVLLAVAGVDLAEVEAELAARAGGVVSRAARNGH